MASVAEANEKVQKTVINMDRFDRIVNGGIDEVVAVDDGQVRSLRGIEEYGKPGPKGNPGGNVMSLGTLAAAKNVAVPNGTDLVTITGVDTVGDGGVGMVLVYDSTVNAAYVTANPRTSFRDTAGRGFRKVLTGQAIDVRTMGALGTNSGNDTPAFLRAARVVDTAVALGIRLTVYVQDGTYPVTFLPGQGISYIGQSRIGTIIRCISNGAESVIDARVSRDGTNNTQGHTRVENLSVNVDGHNRNGITLYGGSCTLRNVEVYGSTSNGIEIQYVLMTVLEQVTTRDNSFDGLLVNVDTIHNGDVNTSIYANTVWSRNNGRYGFNLSNFNYCQFNVCASEQNGGCGWYADVMAGGVNFTASLTLNTCASENDGTTSGPGIGAVFMRLVRSLEINSFFILPRANQDAMTLQNCVGSVKGFRDTAVHTGGTVGLRVIDPPNIGTMIVEGGSFTMRPDEVKGALFDGAEVNGVNMSSVNRLRFNDATEVETFSAYTVPIDQDFSGLAFHDSNGDRVITLRRGGGVVQSSNGPLVAPASMTPGSIHLYATDGTLKAQIRTPSGTVKTATIAYDV